MSVQGQRKIFAAVPAPQTIVRLRHNSGDRAPAYARRRACVPGSRGIEFTLQPSFSAEAEALKPGAQILREATSDFGAGLALSTDTAASAFVRFA